jgi:acyl-coenzyme A thioesterase PaaI-like protein
MSAQGPPLACSRDELNAILEGAEFLRPFRLRVETCAPGECSLLLPYAASLERPGGVVTGIAIMGAADVAMWLAIMTLRGTAEQWVTTDLKTAFLKGARRTDVLCLARVLKLGKRTAYGTADCRGADGGLLAHHVLSYALVAQS